MTITTQPLRYLIGADEEKAIGPAGTLVEVPFDAPYPQGGAVGIGYCNLLDEEYGDGHREYGPYLKQIGTAAEYDEGIIDPRGHGWIKNLERQFALRQKQGFQYVELDNPDSYHIGDVLDAVNRASAFGLKVFAKNPGLMDYAAAAYVGHPAIVGIIVEKSCGSPGPMDILRRQVKQPNMAVRFVSFGDGKGWAQQTANVIARDGYQNMGVTYDAARAEYGGLIKDIVLPA